MLARCSIVIAVAASGCTQAADDRVELRFLADPGPAGEAYQCFGFDAALLGDADIGGIALDEPSGPIALHHVAFFAVPAAFPDGPVACEEMPADAVPLHVWATGGGPLALPPDVELAVPAGTQRLVVQTHALRLGDGPPMPRVLALTPRVGAPHRAGWLPLRAPTPALRPHHAEEAVATCAVAGELHVISTWPHMHKAGRAFVGSLVHGASDTPFITVDPWVYDAQRAYAVEVAVEPGDALDTHCTWQNDTDQTILPGPSIDDEMCGQSLMAWPVEAARCE